MRCAKAARAPIEMALEKTSLGAVVGPFEHSAGLSESSLEATNACLFDASVLHAASSLLVKRRLLAPTQLTGG